MRLTRHGGLTNIWAVSPRCAEKTCKYSVLCFVLQLEIEPKIQACRPP